MTQVQKNFIYNLLVVVISAVLSFLVSYVSAHMTPVDSSALGGGLATLGVCLKKSILLV